MPDVPGPAGLVPYGLTPPKRLIYPERPHRRRGLDERIVHLGESDGSAKITVTAWTGCERSCTGTEPHGGGLAVTLIVGCDSMPHCGSCECGDGHHYRLTSEMITALKEALP